MHQSFEYRNRVAQRALQVFFLLHGPAFSPHEGHMLSEDSINDEGGADRPERRKRERRVAGRRGAKPRPSHDPANPEADSQQDQSEFELQLRSTLG